MKIAFFTNAFPMMSEAFIANSAAALVQAGHSVDIFGIGNVDATGLSVPEVAPLHLEDSTTNIRWPDARAERWRKLPGTLKNVVARHGAGSVFRLQPNIYRRTFMDLSAIYQAAQLPANGDYDIIHCQFAPLAEHVIKHRRAGFLSGRLVVNFRGYDISELVTAHGEHLYDHIWPEAAAFISNSDYFRQRAIAIGCPEDRISVVGSGMRLESFPFQPVSEASSGDIRFLMVGRLIERKGFHIALAALARYSQASGRGIHVDIVGDGPMRAELEQLARDCRMDEAVTLHGAQSHTAIADFIRQCDVFIAPSMTCAKGSQDGPVNTLKEAMAIGRPVIGTRHGGISELVIDGETGLLCEEGNVDALEHAINRILGMQASWPQMLAKAREVVETTYALSRTTDDLIGVYNSILEPSSPTPGDFAGLSKEAA
ncbi:glycosyltransferase [uncultured Hyphomonas sp.]|uniref:glycosyltransferase n=1 Tax=uncultured Hyphomonas sp. TaxID=225298 RepID=UPI002AAB767D|nr:glycosyltransferase [uncultured Hyphomonas sp.]